MLQAEVEVTAITQSLLFFALPRVGAERKEKLGKKSSEEEALFFVLLA